MMTYIHTTIPSCTRTYKQVSLLSILRTFFLWGQRMTDDGDSTTTGDIHTPPLLAIRTYIQDSCPLRRQPYLFGFGSWSAHHDEEEESSLFWLCAFWYGILNCLLLARARQQQQEDERGGPLFFFLLSLLCVSACRSVSPVWWESRKLLIRAEGQTDNRHL